MSQAVPNTPSVVVNTANSRQQVPLRDYLNARVAPFLKKAITESLAAEAEFPLQWLGECLIHQSILYEGNPDQTDIRERFLYKFEDPKPQEQAAAGSSPPPPSPTRLEPVDAPQDVPAQQQPEVSMNEATDVAAEQAPAASMHEEAIPQTTGVTPVINGVKEEGDANGTHEARDIDTEMGGTL